MATAEKTVIFAFDMATALVADAVVTNLTQRTFYIPEASPNFTSIFVEVGFQDVVTATGGTITEYRVGLRLGAAGYTTVTELDDLGNTGEQIAGVVGPYDFTSHFNTNWTGTSMTCDLQVYFDQSTGTTLGMANVTALVYVTYTYDDTAATQIKTVALPMESPAGGLGTSQIAISAIPQLTGVGGLLPEAGVTIRDWFIVIEGNESGNAAVIDATLRHSYDGGAITNFLPQERAMASDRFCRWVVRDMPSAGAAHTFELFLTATGYIYHPVVTLYVTYEFTLSGTTRALNSILLPIEAGSPLGGNTTGTATRITRDLVVSDPGTITMANSAFRINWNSTSSLGTPRFRAGAQAYRAYTDVGGVVCGMFSLQQRIDSGSAQGAALSLTRGLNMITIDGYGSSTSIDMTNINGYLLINYESDVAAEGIGANAHTVLKHVRNFDAAAADRIEMSGFSFSIPPADYWLMGAGFAMNVWNTLSANTVSLDAQYQTGEGPQLGYTDIYVDALQTDAELGCSMIWARGRDVFKRCPQDADPDRMGIETSRLLRFYSAGIARLGMYAAMTYHGITWSVAGTITGNDVALPTDLQLVRAGTREVMQVATLAAGVTAFDFTVYDDTELYYVDAYQDGTHTGRSATGTAA